VSETRIAISDALPLQLCALRGDRTVRCATRLDEPVLVPGLLDGVDLDVGASFACVRRAEGSVRCFAPGERPEPLVF
jgi:hypothetical protein